MKISRHIPLKQRMAMEQKQRLKRLVAEYPYISFYLDDKELMESCSDMLAKVGFICDPIVVKEKKDLIKRLLHASEKGHLILLHYKKKLDGTNVITVLNELKQYKPFKPFRNVIPMFLANIVSGKDSAIFKMLSRFDVRYVIYLTPGAPVEKNLESLFGELRKFQEMVLDSAAPGAAGKPDINLGAERQIKIIERYKDLLRQADEHLNADPERAIELLTEAIELKPDFDTLMKRGDAYYFTHEFILALNDYKEAKDLARGRSDPYAKISACCFNLVKREAGDGGDVDRARKWFSKGMKFLRQAETIIAEIENEESLAEAGAERCTYKNVIFALVEADFRGLGLDEEQSLINDQVAEVMKKTNSSDFMSPDMDVDTRIDYAIMLTRSGHYKAAEQVFRELIRQDTDNAGPAFNNFAVELRKNGEYAKAYGVYAELLKYKIPDRDIVMQNMVMAGRRHAQSLRDAGDGAESMEILEDLVRHCQGAANLEWAYLDMALAHLEAGNKEKAALGLEDARKINPGVAESERFTPYKPLLDI